MRRRNLGVLIAVHVMPLILYTTDLLAAENPWIATWHRNKAAAVSLRFDDSLESHATYVIPKLNEYGFRATFMINPGRQRYKDHRAFWESEVPGMGHELGNHTMHHRGAGTVNEADWEIGEVSRLIWRLYHAKSKLLVFASGGGAKWGGKNWEDASPEYKDLVRKYFLIDLYDGLHPSMSAGSRHGVADLKRAVGRAIAGEGHQPITFHGIGEPDLLDRMKAIYRGYDLTFDRRSFEQFLDFLVQERNRLWIAPLGDILKYEAERKGARLEVVRRNRELLMLELQVGTDRALYNHDLTLVVPTEKNQKVESVVQGKDAVRSYTDGNGRVFIDVKPVSGAITIRFGEHSPGAR